MLNRTWEDVEGEQCPPRALKIRDRVGRVYSRSSDRNAWRGEWHRDPKPVDFELTWPLEPFHVLSREAIWKITKVSVGDSLAPDRRWALLHRTQRDDVDGDFVVIAYTETWTEIVEVLVNMWRILHPKVR